MRTFASYRVVGRVKIKQSINDESNVNERGKHHLDRDALDYPIRKPSALPGSLSEFDLTSGFSESA